MAIAPAVSTAIPDPKAALPSGIWIKVDGAVASAPLRPGTRTSQAQAEAFLSGPKPLRHAKMRIQRAMEIDPEAELARGQAPAPAAHAPSVLAAPGPCMPLAPAFQVGEDDNTTIPPDTHAAVSKTHVVAPHNNNIAIFDRAGPLISRVSMNTFWQGLGLSGHTFDPKVVFDPSTDRFYFVAMADAELPTSRLLIACSDSGDPTQRWKPYAVPVDSNAQGPVWMDYPSLGFSDDKVTVTVNLYTLAGNAFHGATAYVFDKSSLVSTGATISAQRFVLTSMGGTHAPAITRPGTSDQFLVSTWASNAGGKGYLMVLRVSGSVPTATVSRVGYVPVAQTWDSFPPVPDFAPQLGIPNKISVGDDRMLSVHLRDGVLSCVHMVLLPTGSPTTCEIQCWDVPIAKWVPSVLRIAGPEGSFLAHPSHAVNDRGDKLIGCSLLSAARHPSGAFFCIPPGVAPQPANIFATGSDTYLKMFTSSGGTENRWGDYSATMTDPQNDRDFWTAQAYSAPPPPSWQEHGRWATMIVQVGAPSPAAIV